MYFLNPAFLFYEIICKKTYFTDIRMRACNLQNILWEVLFAEKQVASQRVDTVPKPPPHLH